MVCSILLYWIIQTPYIFGINVNARCRRQTAMKQTAVGIVVNSKHTSSLNDIAKYSIVFSCP